MFTKVCEGLVWAEMIVGFVISICEAISIGKSNVGLGFLVFFLCVLLVLVVCAIQGLFVEIGKNIKACRDALERFNSNSAYNSQSSAQNTNGGYFAPTVARNSWDCPKCGNMNGLTNSYCVHCGFRRPQ